MTLSTTPIPPVSAVTLPSETPPVLSNPPVIDPPVIPEEVIDIDNTIAQKTVNTDRYRKGVPPAFPESQPKYFQDELTKIERVFDLANDELIRVTKDGKTLKASIKHEEYIRVTDDLALAYSIDTLKASVDTDRSNTSAMVSAEKTARATADTALATAINTVVTTVNGHSTSLTEFAESINGVSARWGVIINNNNRVTGIQLNSNSSGTTSFDVEADSFNIWIPGTGTKGVYWDGTELVVRGNIRATSITTSAINTLPDNTIDRPIVANPNVIAQGTYSINEKGGYYSYTDGDGVTSDVFRGFTVFIPTGVYVTSSWSTASTNQYLASATIASGSSVSGGCSGYSETNIVVGDGLADATNINAIDNQIYIKYDFSPPVVPESAWSNFGNFTATSLSWKLVRV